MPYISYVRADGSFVDKRSIKDFCLRYGEKNHHVASMFFTVIEGIAEKQQTIDESIEAPGASEATKELLRSLRRETQVHRFACQ